MNESKIYQELGKYIVCFQWMENQLKQIGWHLRTPEDPFASRAYFSNMWFKTTVEKIKDQFSIFLHNRNIDNIQSNIDGFNKTLDQCLSVAYTRNQLIHSTYVFCESYGEVLGMMRSKLGKDIEDHNRVTFDQQDLSENSFDQPLKELAEVCFDLGHLYVQIIHWS